ncbi:hypothetical protein D9M68_589160 [compost metagenome]
MLHALGIREEPRVGHQAGEPENAAELDPHRLGGRRQVERPVGGFERAIGRDDGMHIAARLGHLALAQIALALHAEQRHEACQQRGFHMLPAPGGGALRDGRQDADDQPHSRRQVANGDAHPRWPRLRGARQAHEAGIALRDLVEARPVARRPFAAEARNRRHDQAGMRLRQRCVPQAHRVHRAHFEVFDHDVGCQGHPAKQRQPFRLAEVDADALLAAVGAKIINAYIIIERPPLPRHFAGRHGFHLDDLRAQVPKNHCAERPGKRPRQIQHLQPGQWQTHFVVLL